MFNFCTPARQSVPLIGRVELRRWWGWLVNFGLCSHPASQPFLECSLLGAQFVLSCPDNLALLALTNKPVCPINTVFRVRVILYLRIATFIISFSIQHFICAVIYHLYSGDGWSGFIYNKSANKTRKELKFACVQFEKFADKNILLTPRHCNKTVLFF